LDLLALFVGLEEVAEKGVPQGLKPYLFWRLDHTAEAVCLRDLLRKPLGGVVWGVWLIPLGLMRVLKND
jgi:hypothetical protein